MVEKHGADESIDAITAIDEPNKRARHGQEESQTDEKMTGIENVLTADDITLDTIIQEEEKPSIAGVIIEEFSSNDEEGIPPVNLDINGDAEENEAKVWEILRNSSGKVSGSTNMIHSTSQASAPDRVRRSNAGTPVGSTPPPPIRRSRRAAREPIVEAIEIEMENNELNKSITVESANESIEIDISSLFDQSLRSALPFLIKLIESSASIPGFLKSEIVRLINHQENENSQDKSSSESDTQDDGYLKTKSKWIFELGRIIDEKVVSGKEMEESNGKTEVAILTVRPNEIGPIEEKLSIERADSQKINLIRSDIQTNPWFNAQGQPFSVIYNITSHHHLDSSLLSNGSGHISIATQNHGSSQDQSIRQQELEELRLQNEKLKKELEVALEDNSSAKEQSALLKQLYDDASRSNMEAEIESDRLREENDKLSSQLKEGLKSVRNFSTSRLTELELRLKESNEQVALLKEQNRLTNDAVRTKAALWDAHEARERERQEEIANRQAKREKERRALQEQLLGTGGGVTNVVKLPHEIMLEVDLEKEKIDVENLSGGGIVQNGIQADEDEDELAALQRDAAQHGDTMIELNEDQQQSGTRSRRSRRAKRHSPAILTNGTSLTNQHSSSINAQELADTMNHNQNLAMLAASNELEDQFGFVSQLKKTEEGQTPPIQ